MSDLSETQQIPSSEELFPIPDDINITDADNLLQVRNSIDSDGEEHKQQMDHAHVYDDDSGVIAAAAEGGDGDGGADEVQVIGARRGARTTIQDSARKPSHDDWTLEEAVKEWKSEKKKKSRSWWEKSRIYEVVFKETGAAANPHSEKFKHKVHATINYCVLLFALFCFVFGLFFIFGLLIYVPVIADCGIGSVHIF